MIGPSHRITVVTPTIPPRIRAYERAMDSVRNQLYQPVGFSTAIDRDHNGAGVTRTQALAGATTEWVAFLDDDDVMLPHHLQRCVEAQIGSGADVIIPWFEVVGGTDPFPDNRGVAPDEHGMPSFGITCLVRRAAIGDVTFEAEPWPEDYHFWKKLYANGATFHAIPDITWEWHHHINNTSGKPVW